MRQLDEQWIENGRMYKAVKGLCERCCVSHLCNLSADCPIVWGLIAIDLGPVNEDGLLGCPFCGEFPTIKEELDENDESIYAVEHECEAVVITTGWNHDKQGVKDAWNRRN